LTWRNVDLASGTLRVKGTKTENADRTVYILAPLRDELDALMVRRVDRAALVFGTKSGKQDSPSNVRTRLVAPALKAANEQLEKDREEVGPEHLTPHGLRHTFASLLPAIGENPRYVMGQLGHADRRSRCGSTRRRWTGATGSRSG
jgi:integrase